MRFSFVMNKTSCDETKELVTSRDATNSSPDATTKTRQEPRKTHSKRFPVRHVVVVVVVSNVDKDAMGLLCVHIPASHTQDARFSLSLSGNYLSANSSTLLWSSWLGSVGASRSSWLGTKKKEKNRLVTTWWIQALLQHSKLIGNVSRLTRALMTPTGTCKNPPPPRPRQLLQPPPPPPPTTTTTTTTNDTNKQTHNTIIFVVVHRRKKRNTPTDIQMHKTPAERHTTTTTRVTCRATNKRNSINNAFVRHILFTIHCAVVFRIITIIIIIIRTRATTTTTTTTAQNTWGMCAPETDDTQTEVWGVYPV